MEQQIHLLPVLDGWKSKREPTKLTDRGSIHSHIFHTIICSMDYSFFLFTQPVIHVLIHSWIYQSYFYLLLHTITEIIYLFIHLSTH